MITGLPTVGGSLTGLIFLMARRTALAALADGEAVGAGGDCFGMDGSGVRHCKGNVTPGDEFQSRIIWR